MPEDRKIIRSRKDIADDVARKIFDRLEELDGHPAKVAEEFHCEVAVVFAIYEEFSKASVAGAGSVPESPPVYAFPVFTDEMLPYDDEPQDLRKSENSKGEMELTFLASKEVVKTLDDMIRAADVDLETWYVHDWEATAWNTPMKVKKRGEDKPSIVQCHRVRMSLRRIVSAAVRDGLDRLFSRMADHAPDYSLVKPRPRLAAKEEILAVLCLYDVHFGKMAWGPETNSNYDLRIAESLFESAVEDLFDRAVGREVSRILMPLGNDLYHINSSTRNETAAGTVQDQDGRYAKMVEICEMAHVRAIDRVIARCPIDIEYVPGNHGPTAEYHSSRFLKAWYRNCGLVAVNDSPNPRKYYEYGVSLIGLTHGNEEKRDALPGLMANERPDAWARSKTRHWYIGHYHQAKQYQTKPLETRDGVEIRIIRSLAGNDFWHHKKGYLNLSQAAEAFFHGKESGYLGHDVSYARSALAS